MNRCKPSLKLLISAVGFGLTVSWAAAPALAQNRDPNGYYGPSSQPGAGHRRKSEHVLEARDLTTGQIAGKTLDRVIFIDVLDLKPYDGPGGTYIYPGASPYSYTLLNQNDGVGNHVLLGVVERPDDTGLMGVWHFDGNALDSSGHGHNGQISSASHVTQTTGMTGSAYHFDGQGNIDLGNLDFSGANYTVSLWAKTTYVPGDSDYRIMVGKPDTVVGDQTFEMVLGDGRAAGGGNGPIYVVWDNGNGVANVAPFSHNGRDGNWHMYTATYTTGSQKLYMDGVLVASATYNGPLPLVSSGVKIGGFENFGPYHHPWIGDIDEVYIYGRVLDASEVAQLCGIGSRNTSPVVTSVGPSVVYAGGPAFTLTVNGSGFAANAVVRWRGTVRPTTYVSSEQLTASIPASLIVNPGVAAVTVTNPSSGQISNAEAVSIVTLLSSVTLNLTSVMGGASPMGTVTLNMPAPAGGATVSLSSNSGAASLPAVIALAAGQTSATFTITTTPVAVNTPARISAKLLGTTKTATLSVRAAALSSLKLNPTVVKGGAQNSTATVTLTGPAPAGGLVVGLSSGSPSAQAPANVTIPAGASSATFTVTTSAVSASISVGISATLGVVSRTARLTVTK